MGNDVILEYKSENILFTVGPKTRAGLSTVNNVSGWSLKNSLTKKKAI